VAPTPRRGVALFFGLIRISRNLLIKPPLPKNPWRGGVGSHVGVTRTLLATGFFFRIVKLRMASVMLTHRLFSQDRTRAARVLPPLRTLKTLPFWRKIRPPGGVSPNTRVNPFFCEKPFVKHVILVTFLFTHVRILKKTNPCDSERNKG